MKPKNNFLKEVHSWPEEARRVLGGALFLISAVLVFILWRQGVAYDLSSISRESKQASEKRYDETYAPPRPLVGIAETLGSIKEIFR